MDASLPLVGVGSDGSSVEQWDGHRPPAGVMLRWFAPDDLGYPDFGFDVYRAFVDDVLPFRFDDAAVAGIVGQQQVLVDGRVLLTTTDPAGLQFQPHGVSNALLVPADATLTIGFPGRAWDLYLGAATFGSPLTVEAFAAGVSRGTESLVPGQQLNWRTRGLDEVRVTGDGGIALIGYRLVNAPYKWSLLGHRSLPVSDPAYPDPAKPAPGNEAAEAQSWLTSDARADWDATYGPGFAELLATLTALALHQPTPSVPASSDPDPPRMATDYGELLRAALVDPHIGRMVGLAWDDGTAVGLSQLLAYKVVGRWRGRTFKARPGEAELATLGLEVRQAGVTLPVTVASTYDADLAAGPLEIGLGTAVEEFVLTLTSDDLIEVVAFDVAGTELDRRQTAPPSHLVGLVGSGIERVELHGIGRVSIASFRWRVAFVERHGLIPGMSAADPGPPAGPGWVKATQSSPADNRRVEAELDWDTPLPAAAAPELASVGVQVGRLMIGNNPLAPQPTVPPFRSKYLLRDGGVAITPPSLAARLSPRALMRDVGPDASGLLDGWYAWWVRSVDLFGRCSAVTAPATLAVVDAVPPPPPMIVLAEQVQGDLPDSLVTMLGRSPLAEAWLAANPAEDALTCCLAWTPELAALAPDVDAFVVYVRRPLRLTPADSRDPAETYAGVPWGTAVASIGPVPTVVLGVVAQAGTSLAPVAVTAVSAELAIGVGDPRRYWVTTDLTLDTGSGDLTGATLTGMAAGADAYDVAGNGEGATARLLVTAAAGVSPPTPGTYELARGTSGLVTVEAGTAVPATGDTFRRAYGGLLLVADPSGGPDRRYRALGIRDGMLVCTDRDPDDPGPGEPPPDVGAAAWWYPAWAFTIADTGFGPVAGAAAPVARAQVAATAARRFGTSRAVESAPSAPATVLAVDTTVPATPTLPEIQTGEYCAQLATAADWYGISRFTLDFTPAAGVVYIVFRALADAVFRLDFARRATPGYSLDLARPWMAPLLAGVRGQVVTDDFADLAAALAVAGGDPDAIEAAYEALHVDAARIIAAQTWVEPAYVQRHGTPLTPAEIPFVDEFEGRSRSHWFYRVAARSAAGVPSGWSEPTPPICSPDVVPPTTPVARLALADDLAVKVSWLPVPADVDHYLMYRGRDEAEVADPQNLTPIRTVPAATVTGSLIEVTVACEPGRWCFRVVAVGPAGNRSRPSGIIAGHALQPPPPAPEWLDAVRTGDAVHLTWEPGGSPLTDPRLACLVERRPAAGGFWSSISGWLPRAVYEFDDEPPNPDAGWEYRLRVRDALGQVAAVLPTISIGER